MRAVLVDLDAGLRLGLRVGVAAQVLAALHDEHLLAQLGGCALGHGQAEESRSNNNEVICSHGHQLKAVTRAKRRVTPKRENSRVTPSFTPTPDVTSVPLVNFLRFF